MGRRVGSSSSWLASWKWLFLAFVVGLVAPMFVVSDASAGPDPIKLKAAGEAFEAGAKAFKEERFEEAAASFETADDNAPSAKALRFAIRARTKANQGSRAASLAALALQRHADDAETKKLATETIDAFGPKLHKVDISCVSPCLLAVGTRLVHGEASTRWVLYVDPGKITIGASFMANLAATDQTLDAVAGGSSTLRFVPVEPPKGGGGEGGSSQGGSNQGGSGQGGSNQGGSNQGGSGEGASNQGGSGEGGSGSGGSDSGGSNWRIHPAFFVVGLVATAGVGATTIWSGIDTINDPGTDRVREECAGQGEDCQLYQDGQAKELRTNALIGVTAGLAAVTVVLAIVTDWGGGSSDAKKDEEPKAGLEAPRLWVSFGDAKGQEGPFEDVRLQLDVLGRF